MTKVCLLDLNFTLVANSSVKASPFTKQIEGETYRHELIAELIASEWYVILVTARPARYSAATLQSIKRKTSWQPAEWYFNESGLAPPLMKEDVLTRHILPAYKAEDLRAVESNPATRAMYAKYNVRALRWDQFLG